MFTRMPPSTRLATAAVATSALVLLGLLALRGDRAQAQGVMSVPACQCSAPTALPGLSGTVVHCVCGGISCVVSEHTGPGKSTNLMQCVK